MFVSPEVRGGGVPGFSVLDQERRLNWYDAGLRHLCLPGAEGTEPLAVVLTHGSHIVLDDEQELLDATGGGGAACHGFNHPHIGMAVARQLERMPHVPLDGLIHPGAAKLAERLVRLLPEGLDRVIFTESGSSAMEAALGAVLNHWTAKGEGARRKFLAFKGSWHGGTAATLALGDVPHIRRCARRKLVSRQFHAPLPADDASAAAFETVAARHAGTLAGIVVEPLVQAAAGWKFHDVAVLRRIRALADRYRVPLVFDECFTGFGRTGAMFACTQAGVAPDIVVLGKALTGGTLPLAAAVVRGDLLNDALPPRASAFSANAMACAAAGASLDLFEHEPRLEQAAEIARQLTAALETCRSLPGVRDVRVMGAVGAVEFRRIADHAEFRRRFAEAGVYVQTAGNALGLTPALNIEPYDLSALLGTVLKVLHEATRRRTRRGHSPDQDDLPF